MGRRFTHRNEGFSCLLCAHLVAPLKGSCRNHCPKCLSSMHVDINPGDRANECKGLMQPVQIVMKTDSQILVHRCTVCGHLQRNRIAVDDDLEKVLEIMRTNPLSTERKH